MPFAIILTPGRQLRLVPASPDQTWNTTSAESRLTAAFADGSGAGLVHLAGAYAFAQLDEGEKYWRDFAKHRLAAELAGGNTTLDGLELERWLKIAPALSGGEYLDQITLRQLWASMTPTINAMTEQAGGLQQALGQLDPAWDAVARVCFSLAENRSNEALPFALLATYTTRLSGDARPKHAPLARALKDQADKANTAQLARITAALKAAQAVSPLIADLVSSKKIFQPQALSISEAHRFLRDAVALEEAGLMVRVPDWWSLKNPARPKVQVTVGDKQPSGAGASALLDFRVQVTLDGQALSKDEWQTLRKAIGGLVFLRGRWIEADADRLAEVLEHWQQGAALANGQGVPFALAMRWVVGGGPGATPLAQTAVASAAQDISLWSEVKAGPWLEQALASLAEPPTNIEAALRQAQLRASLRPYQLRGVAWMDKLATLGLGGLLADDMGLGKTLQVLAFLALRFSASQGQGRYLVVAPATLVPTWLAEATRFVPSLTTFAAHPSLQGGADLRQKPAASEGAALVVTSYGGLMRYPWLSQEPWDVLVLDEAQAIKNPDTRQAESCKQCPAHLRLALTGTPVENRPQDLWSLFDFINPGLLGSARQFADFLKTSKDGKTPAAATLRALVRPYILRRLKTDKSVVADLPSKTEIEVTCALTPAQAVLYERIVDDLRRDLQTADGIKRRGVVLAALMKLKQTVNHPCLAIGHGDFARKGSGKLQRLAAIAGELAERQEKLLVFTQFREMTAILARELAATFGQDGLVLHGDTPVRERKKMVDLFQNEDGPPFFVLSLKAGGTGLTLTAATHVVHFDRWWNPAVEDQATDRAYRIGQKSPVMVHKFQCTGTVEAKVAKLLTDKRQIARELLSDSGEVSLTELSNDELLRLVTLDINSAALAQADGD